MCHLDAYLQLVSDCCGQLRVQMTVSSGDAVVHVWLVAVRPRQRRQHPAHLRRDLLQDQQQGFA